MAGERAAGPKRSGEPVVPRPAATLVLVRDCLEGAGFEVLMLRRNLRSDFVGGAYVFPGGALDEEDGAVAAGQLAGGLDDARASALLGLPSGGLAYWVAAVRETFEEAGVLLAGRAAGDPIVSFAAPADAERFVGHRHDLNAKRASFSSLLEEENLVLALDRVHYIAHWITPEGSPRRYDTRFFVAAAPDGQTPAHDAGETISDLWVRPADALARHRAGAMEMILPTIRTLEAIGRWPDAAGLLAAAARSVPVPTIEPRLVREGGTVRLLLPGDPGYGDTSLERADPAELDAAVRAATRPPAAPGGGR